MLNPQGLVALTVLGMVGFMLLLSKIFTKLWLYLLLLSPSWGISIYNAFQAVANGEAFDSILFNHVAGIIFFLAPIDEYLITDPTLCIYGAALLGIWAYIIIITCKSLLKGWMLPVAPLAFWIFGKGLPNTMNTLSPYLPSWLLDVSGLPLILLICLVIGAALFIVKRKR